MKIESIIRRATGSTVVLGKTTYRFLPDETKRHVCNVEDDDHIDRLLSIREGFRAVEDEEEVSALAPERKPAPLVEQTEVAATPDGDQKPRLEAPQSESKAVAKGETKPRKAKGEA